MRLLGQIAQLQHIAQNRDLFRPGLAPSPWLRFNVVYCDNDRLFRFMAEALEHPDRRDGIDSIGRGNP